MYIGENRLEEQKRGREGGRKERKERCDERAGKQTGGTNEKSIIFKVNKEINYKSESIS